MHRTLRVSMLPRNHNGKSWQGCSCSSLEPRRCQYFSVLVHTHLKGDDTTGLTSYEQAEAVQEKHRSRFLAWKHDANKQLPLASKPGVLKPQLISFEATPTFTLGRRQEDLSAEQAASLQQPLEVNLADRSPPQTASFRPQVRKTNRGGLTTYHGPGQLVLWPVLDMHSSLYPRYGVASYANHLETTTQKLLLDLFGIRTYVARDEPGVWVVRRSGQPRKIAALGVHHRRYVTALGIAVNIDVPVTGSETSNPWARFVPCGLEGKLVTSVAAEVGSGKVVDWRPDDLAHQWAVIFEKGLLDDSKRNGGSAEAKSRLLLQEQ